MKSVRYRGLDQTQETKPADSIRDTRSVVYLAYDFFASYWGSMISIAIMVVLIYIFPLINDLLFCFALLIFWCALWQLPKLPFRMPIGSKAVDTSDSSIVGRQYTKAKGLYYFGNEIGSNHEMWFSADDMRTHALIFGSTGSGKTQSLLSLAFNALTQGSGFIYVDGKGDNTLFSQIFSMARYMGREDDLLVINYMTGAKDIIGPQKEVLSNTLNPFAVGSSSMLSQLVVSLLPSSSQSSDGDMWKGRAIAFVEALMRVLVYLRDQRYIKLDAGLIRKYFILDNIEQLLENQIAINQDNQEIKVTQPIPHDVIDPIYNYLATLPGYKRSNLGKQSDKTYEQHGYISMQLTRVFGSLADVYAHIMRTDIAEVDFSDIVLNRRILVVLLPALEKSPDELANLGKLIIASLKVMLASGLGNKLQGKHKDVIEAKPSNAEVPFLCILDEYGYYAVEGFAVVPAQARSLGFSVVFAGQDIPAFQKASKEEAASIFANTNIKICMKLEDPTETWDFFNKTAGEAYVSTVRTYNMGPNGTGIGYQDAKEAGIEKRARLDLMDLKEQRPGEAHVFFKSKIIRGQMMMYYKSAPKVDDLRLNQFLRLNDPDEIYVQAIIKGAQLAKEVCQHTKVMPNFHSDILKQAFSVNSVESPEYLAVDKVPIQQMSYNTDDDILDELSDAVDFTMDGEPLLSAQADEKQRQLNCLGVLFSVIDVENSTDWLCDIQLSSPEFLNLELLTTLHYRFEIMQGKRPDHIKSQIDNLEKRLLEASCAYYPVNMQKLENKIAYALAKEQK